MSTPYLSGNRTIALVDRGTGAVFLAVFLYALSAGLLIQLFILPVLLPHLHAGHGLLKGVDSVGFHEIASELADRVLTHGWGAWEVRPNSHSPAGIAGALYAITGVREPWVMVPVNAVLFALSAATIFAIIRQMTENTVASWAAVLPFALFPSAAIEYADLHKDVWSCAGSMLILFAFGRAQIAQPLKLEDVVTALVICLMGALLVWIARAYLVRVLLYASVVAVVALVAIEIALNRFRINRDLLKRCAVFLAVFGILAAVSKIPTEDARRGMPDVHTVAPFAARSENAAASAPPAAFGILNDAVASIMSLRRGFLTTYPDAGSMIDPYVVLASPSDFLSYVPRALQIGILAPFPSMWFGIGVSPGAGIMRAMTGVEMALSYILLLGIPLAIPLISGRAIGAGFLALTICAIVVCLIVLAIPIVGTLHRMRYGYFMLVVGLGAAGWIMAIRLILERFRTVRI